MKKTILILTLSISLSVFSSALVKRDDDARILTVIARMVYSGSAVTEELARLSTDEIHNMWNGAPTLVSLNGKAYSVEFQVDYVLGGGVLVEADSCAHNFIQILPKTNAGDRSYYSGLGSRNGVFYTSDGLGHSTTAAHEFGHGLLLDHNAPNQVLALVPGIMFARGTLVRQEFQWDTRVLAGAPGGTINPVHRHVRAEDVKAIPFFRVKFNAKNLGCLGNGLDLDIL